jgi:hypothetical protein
MLRENRATNADYNNIQLLKSIKLAVSILLNSIRRMLKFMMITVTGVNLFAAQWRFALKITAFV